MFCRPSPRVAEDPISPAIRCLAIPSIGMVINDTVARPMPSNDSSGRSPLISAAIDSYATYGASRKNCAATSFWARSSAPWLNVRYQRSAR